jgi:hypothetical protein
MQTIHEGCPICNHPDRKWIEDWYMGQGNNWDNSAHGAINVEWEDVSVHFNEDHHLEIRENNGTR